MSKSLIQHIVLEKGKKATLCGTPQQTVFGISRNSKTEKCWVCHSMIGGLSVRQ